jgi:N-formylglutamate amidohydrolase
MSRSVVDQFDPPFEVIEPTRTTTPLVFNSPHSGSVYPAGFLDASRLDALTLRRSEDSFVDELVAGVVDFGAPLMRAHFPRAFLDVNREPYELDPRMFDGRLPPFANTRSMRVAGGLGTIARVVGDSQEIYARRLSVEDALARIEHLYKPYHRMLQRTLQRTHRRFGLAVLVDCHSMPSSPCREDCARADFVIGDRYGTSASAVLTDVVDHALRSRGYAVTRNKPYAGGFITEHYGNPAADCHALQIEVNRALYMDERRFAKSQDFERIAADMLAVAQALHQAIHDGWLGGRLAAE